MDSKMVEWQNLIEVGAGSVMQAPLGDPCRVYLGRDSRRWGKRRIGMYHAVTNRTDSVRTTGPQSVRELRSAGRW